MGLTRQRETTSSRFCASSTNAKSGLRSRPRPRGLLLQPEALRRTAAIGPSKTLEEVKQAHYETGGGRPDPTTLLMGGCRRGGCTGSSHNRTRPGLVGPRPPPQGTELGGGWLGRAPRRPLTWLPRSAWPALGGPLRGGERASPVASHAEQGAGIRAERPRPAPGRTGNAARAAAHTGRLVSLCPLRPA